MKYDFTAIEKYHGFADYRGGGHFSGRITAGIVAAGFGFILVAIFMFIYYWFSGLVANVALFLDIALLPTALVICANILGVFAHDPSMGGGGSMQLPVLTMPGIAGLVLSLGMAVDANILIFERTKEELKAGRTLFTAINSGFDRAWTSIFDSNMTTIITCAILYFCGTSIVKGFALTLALGVMVSMFSAITITKNFMHLVFGTGNLKNPALFGLRPEEIGEGFQAVETKREKAKFGILD